MPLTRRILFLTIIFTSRYAAGQTFCDVCTCIPPSDKPVEGICIGSENLTAFPVNISTSIVNLRVQDIPITQLSYSDLAGLSQLQGLIIINNIKLTTIEANTFQDQTKLNTLNLAGNNISSITGEIFTNLSRLTHLTLDSNSISAIPDNICTVLSSLGQLDMSNNSLGSIGTNTFKGCADMVSIDLSYNNIVDIALDAFQDTTILSSLNLVGNRLTTLRSSWIVNLTLLSTFTMDSEFTCTQSIKDEYEAMKTAHPALIGCDEMNKFCPKCINFNNEAIENITSEQLDVTTAQTNQETTAQQMVTKATQIPGVNPSESSQTGSAPNTAAPSMSNGNTTAISSINMTTKDSNAVTRLRFSVIPTIITAITTRLLVRA